MHSARKNQNARQSRNRSQLRTMAPKKRQKPKGRPRLPGGQGRRPKKYQLTSFTAGHKHEILNHLDINRNIALTIQKFYPTLAEAKYNSQRALILSWRPALDKMTADRADDEIFHAMLLSGMIEEGASEFSLEDDFDDLYRAVAEVD